MACISLRNSILIYLLSVFSAFLPAQDGNESVNSALTADVSGGEGIATSAFSEQMLRAQGQAAPQGAFVTAESTAWFEYVKVINCPGNTIDNVATAYCISADNYCQANEPDSAGPWSRLYRRVVNTGGEVGDWQNLGLTCFTDAVPATSGAPEDTLGIGDIVAQFHRTDFALPHASIEPPGGRTLVHLPTFYALEWPSDGVEPQEVDTTTLVGREVRIRPMFVNATYQFGDGESSGPVESLGGAYPAGDVQHIYSSKATVEASISVTYGGEYSVDGAEWEPIPGSITVDGPAQTVEVLASRNRLVGGDQASGSD